MRSAVSCAALICRTSDRGEASVLNEINPALHVGIGAGHLWAAALGGQPVWTLLAGGEAIEQAATAQATARSWSYELSDAAAQKLAGEIAAGEPKTWLGLGDCLELPPLDWLTGFLPTQVKEFYRLLIGAKVPFAGRWHLCRIP